MSTRESTAEGLIPAAADESSCAFSPAAEQSAAQPVAAKPSSGACKYWCVELDFETKADKLVTVEEGVAAVAAGRFVWFDVDVADPTKARASLQELMLIDDQILNDAMAGEATTKHARYPEQLHLVLSGCRLEGKSFDLERVDVVIGERFMMTVHKGPVLFLSEIKSGYREDFRHHAKSPSFLIYEVWDHLVHNYVDVQSRIEERVLKLQRELITNVQDRVFTEVSELDADLLHFRKVLLPARAVLADLATRKSRFISEATQPFLANMVGSVESVLQDLLVDREVLEGSLNLYVSMVSHRTNDIMRKLTLVSVIFMPLTFLVGVYGMNFKTFPELNWEYGYLYFWIAVGLIVSGLLGVMKRRKLL